MNYFSFPQQTDWDVILKRPLMDYSSLYAIVQPILEQVKLGGDKALIALEEKFDKIKLESVKVSDDELDEVENLLDDKLKKAIFQAAKNIKLFHQSQKLATKPVEVMPGVTCWQKSVGIEKVGLYVPGGTAPLFSTVLMLAIPAYIAGCKEIVLCTPPNKEGKVHPAILLAAKIAHVSSVYKVGGAQAIAAMAYGTESIPKVYKIFGPGNQFVTVAKQLLSLRQVAIDMPAGPSEVEVLADETANPAFVAADLLSQAEHGLDSQAILVTNSEILAQEVALEVEKQLAVLPRRSIAERSLENSKIIVLKSLQEMIDITNEYAPEHLIVVTKNYREVAEKIVNAGSLFLGNYSCESAGDYASGTNHTLPTNGYAKAYNGVNLDSFVRKITFQELTEEGLLNLGETIEIMAENECLDAHKQAVTIRLKEINKGK